jgi:hypothetical protein
VGTRLNGIVKSKPQLPDKDQRHVAFFLYRDKTYEEISCVSSIRFDTSTKFKRFDKVVLLGKWERGLVSGQTMPPFLFNSATHRPAENPN